MSGSNNFSLKGPSLAGRNVIICIAPLELGGSERQAILLARHLVREQGAEVEVWGMGEPGRAAELCDEYGIRWRSAPLPLPWSENRRWQLKRLAKFALALRRAKPYVILPFMFLPSAVCAIVWRFSGARTCIWNQRCEGRDRLPRWAERVAVRATPYFIANSEHGADFLVEAVGVKRDRIRIVHNGVETARPALDRMTWRRDLGVGAETFLACMVANLHVFKDHETLLRAWRVVVDQLAALGRDAVLLLAGRFDDNHLFLKELAANLELGASVRFLGQVKDISGLLNAVDLGVHSSVKEGCPNGVLECMAAGLAVAGTDYAGIREAVGPQGFALLAPPGDAEALAKLIIGLALNADARREAGEANRQRVEHEFAPQEMFRKTLSVVGEGLGMSPRGLPASTLAPD